MKLHLLGIPHTYTHPSFSCCAFTGKVLRFSPMMQYEGHHVIHYGNAGSESGAKEQVEILDAEEYKKLGGCEPGDEQYGNSAQIGSKLYQEFNGHLGQELEARVEPGDIICLPFGTAHMEALTGPRCKMAFWVETGIGYRQAFTRHRIYESNAWMNVHLGRETPNGVVMGYDYWFTIPNYYEPEDWPLGIGKMPSNEKPTIAFMGRLNEDKGLRIIEEIAKRMPHVDFTICGQGDPSPWVRKNVYPVSPFHGPPSEGRANYLGNAHAVICPTRYVEPFGGVAVEALLCGTPVIASAFGAFPEYIQDGFNGWLPRTLDDWITAVEKAITKGPDWDRDVIRNVAAHRFSMWNLSGQYTMAFAQISDLQRGGWYCDQL